MSGSQVRLLSPACFLSCSETTGVEGSRDFFFSASARQTGAPTFLRSGGWPTRSDPPRCCGGERRAPTPVAGFFFSPSCMTIKPHSIGMGTCPAVPSEPSSARRAFTLVEITLVLLIIAVVAAIGIPSLVRSRVNANESAAIGNLRTLASALETYKAANAAYPDSATRLRLRPTTWSSRTCLAAWPPGL